MDKYKVGTRVRYNDFYGIVINNVKLAGDICVDWGKGQIISYDAEWLDENVEITRSVN